MCDVYYIITSRNCDIWARNNKYTTGNAIVIRRSFNKHNYLEYLIQADMQIKLDRAGYR